MHVRLTSAGQVRPQFSGHSPANMRLVVLNLQASETSLRVTWILKRQLMQKTACFKNNNILPHVSVCQVRRCGILNVVHLCLRRSPRLPNRLPILQPLNVFDVFWVPSPLLHILLLPGLFSWLRHWMPLSVQSVIINILHMKTQALSCSAPLCRAYTYHRLTS